MDCTVVCAETVTVCSMPATNRMHSTAPMFDSHATVHETMRLQTTHSAGEPVSIMLPTTPPKPVVVEVVK